MEGTILRIFWTSTETIRPKDDDGGVIFIDSILTSRNVTTVSGAAAICRMYQLLFNTMYSSHDVTARLKMVLTTRLRLPSINDVVT